MDKHSIKKDGSNANHTKIFSYSDRRNLIDVASNFANFMKQNHNEIKFAKDVESKHIQEFLNSKSSTCTNATLNNYVIALGKVGRLVNSNYKGVNVDFKKDIIVPNGKENTRTISMTRDDFNKLKTHIQDSKSHSVKAIDLAEKLGLRVSETTKLQARDIKIISSDKARISVIDSKGKRDRFLEIKNQNDVKYLQNLKEFCSSENERIVPIRDDSVNKFLQEKLKDCGLEKYSHARTGIHSIRKMIAQERYDSLRNEGVSRVDSLNEVSHFLGHGDDRDECMSRYIDNIH